MNFQSLKSKFMMVSILPIFFLIIVSIVGYQTIVEFKNSLDYVYSVRTNLMIHVAQIDSSVHALGRWMWLAFVTQAQPEEQKIYISRAKAEINDIDEAMKEYLLLPRNEKVTDLFSNIELSWPKAKMECFELMNILQENKVSPERIKTLMMSKLATNLLPITTTLNSVNSTMDELLKAEIKEKQTFANNRKLFISFFSVLAIIMVFLLSNLIANQSARKLLMLTNKVSEAGSQVLTATGALTDASEQLSNDSQTQASAIIETSSAVAIISRAVDSNIMASESATNLSEEIQALSQKTKGLMEDLSVAMKHILDSNMKIENLTKTIGEIGNKTEIIDEIVFKTQLLSFNASVEAERAGAHGRGFAVVAQEVGNLAQMSGQAATEISAIVKESIFEADIASTENKKRVTSGDQLAVQTRAQMIEVASKIEDIIASIKNIVYASREQKDGLDQVAMSMESLNTITQKTANLSQITSSSSEELQGQSGSLLDLVEELKIAVVGKV